MHASSESPAWWKEAVFYQIYPRSFADANGDGVGDLAGIASKLDYLQALGVDALWISPIYASPNDDNGYDISDYLAVGPEYGTLDDFAALSRGLKERGMKLILDQVLNHTSDEHPWFQESRSSRSNPKRGWYHWADPKGFDPAGKPIPPNNWKSVFEGPAWEWDEATGQFYLHCFSRKQPDLNWANPEVRRALHAVLDVWIDRGADGFRLDVINMIAKAPGYPDVPRPEGNTDPLLPLDRHGVNQYPVHDYLRELHEAVFAGRDLYAVGETWWVDESNTLEFTGYDRRELHGAFYFYFHQCASGRDHFRHFARLREATAGKSWLTVTLGNHDSRRILTKFGDPAGHPFASATLLAAWLLTLPATPFLFQGDELGLTDTAFASIGDYRDIQTVNRHRELVAKGRDAAEALAEVARESRDNSRTPIPWDGTPGGGFSAGVPWIPLPEAHLPLHAAGAAADPGSILNAYKALLALRKRVKSLVYGPFQALSDEGPVLAYRRGAWEGHPAVDVVLNWSSERRPWPPGTDPASEVLFSNHPDRDVSGLRPWEAVVLRVS
ncbi:MAG TPA: alpha-glucosidase [Candidatus Methylacidiphilales bacterium]